MTSKTGTVKELTRIKFEMLRLGFNLFSCLGKVINFLKLNFLSKNKVVSGCPSLSH